MLDVPASVTEQKLIVPFVPNWSLKVHTISKQYCLGTSGKNTGNFCIAFFTLFGYGTANSNRVANEKRQNEVCDQRYLYAYDDKPTQSCGSPLNREVRTGEIRIDSKDDNCKNNCHFIAVRQVQMNPVGEPELKTRHFLSAIVAKCHFISIALAIHHVQKFSHRARFI